ncbi:glycosyl transferase, group 1 [Fimbriimonas ginsengisoli Gsoil 348]|uniref:Glycosyl transferase, group 1 n=1 Tax=Fimbriimonas ginsengisoli Gsoil 348 TaxID=661478 RepID=A0A068NVF0_FIMGI|nr:glycosyl transferase, group 1 [Fimbriimonas ginsengisoli Gsoil 348]
MEIACPPGSPISERASHPTEPITVRGKFDLKGLAAYLRLFRSQQFDVVHAHFSPDFTLPAYAARMRRQGLTVMTRHVALQWSSPKAKAYSRLWRHIIPVSHAVERRLLQSGIPASQMTVAKAGLPEPIPRRKRKDARAALWLEPNEFVVGSFGRLVPDKGIDVLIEAMRQVDGVKACIFGHGPYAEDLRTKAAGLKSVMFQGSVADVADAMAAMDVVVIPSTWEEAFPYAALEAMALSRPIVASNIGGLPEMVEDGVNGRLFPPGDASALAAVLNEMKSANREPMGAAGRARYEQEFTIEKMAERIEAVFLAAIGK